jgi:hypothetical protein
LLSTSSPDLVLLDLKMSGMDGLDVLKAIKETDANVEAIMMTGYASLESVRGAMSYGASGYLIKPFREGEIEEAVKKALVRRANRTGGQQEVRTLLTQLLALAQSSTADSALLDPMGVVLAQVQHLIDAATTLLYVRESDGAAFRQALALHYPPALQPALESPAWVALLSHTLAADQVELLQATPRAEAPALPPALRALGYTDGLLCPIRTAPDGAGVLAFLASTGRP